MVVGVAGDEEGGEGEDQVVWRNLRPGPSQRDVSDARKSADTSLRREGWRDLVWRGSEGRRANTAV